MKNIFKGIKNIIDYAPIIFQDRDYDYEYLLTLMEFKLDRMHKFFDNSNISTEDATTAQQIKDTLDAFDKYKECEYQYDFDGETQFLNQFFDLIKEKIRAWWN